MEIDDEWYDEWKEKVKEVPDTMKFLLGRDLWETDKKNGWKNSAECIMRGRNWDAVIGLIENTMKMWEMLTEADDLIAKSIIKGSVTDKEVITKLSEIESKTDILSDRLMPDSTICEKLDDIKLVMDKLCADKESDHRSTSSENAELDNAAPESVPGRNPFVKKDGVKRKDRRQNVMVFLPAYMDSPRQDKDVENALSYLGCDRGSILDMEMVMDRSDDCNGKIVLRVQMDTVKQASKALANACQLKNYSVPGIYIAKDMTYYQRIKLRELVKKLRSNIEMLPKYRWKIVDWEVVSVGLFKRKEPKCDLKYSYREMWDNLSMSD